MRNSIFVKFIAIALCAAALLTIAGSSLSIIILTQMGLYDKTVQEAYGERLEGEAYSCAQQIAQNYASINLGGCPEEMIGHFHYFNSGYYGYILKDEAGLVLETLNPDNAVTAEDAYHLVLPVSGSYMQVIDSYRREPDATENTVAPEEYTFHDYIGDEDSIVYGLTVSTDYESSGVTYEEPMGILYHAGDGRVCFDSLEPCEFDLPQGDVTGITFYNVNGYPIYAVSSAEAIGTVYSDEGGFLHFISELSSAHIPSAQAAASDVAPASAYAETLPESKIATDATEAPALDVLYFSYYDTSAECEMTVEYSWKVMPKYTVIMTLLPGATSDESTYTLASILSDYKDAFPWLLAAGLLVFAITAVYLCCAAGRSPGSDELRIAGLNRLPLDLYLAAAFLVLCILFWICAEGGEELFRGNAAVGLGFVAILGYLMALVVVAFCFAFAAQAKLRSGWWWKHSITGWVLRQIYKALRWVGRGLGFFARGCRAVFRLMPVIWQWLLTAAAMVLLPALFFLLTILSYGIGELFWGLLCFMSLLADVTVVIYGGWCFGTLMKGAKAMAGGDLNHPIPTRYMLGSFKDFGIQLNNLAGAAYVAAEKQLKSERMKTELITNVSHDIKTPLTSIINFVDLLKMPHTEAQGAEYLDVLDRQSQRLKKLIDDLMEMSKASTGNLTVELSQVDPVEAVNQALGEFSDKLDAAHLTPVFRTPDEPVMMLADGRLVWRVLSNLLGNAVKYALPDTRLYIDLMVLQGNAVIAIKNISREQLNVGADELMERFVRGDTARNTEGSGLGLNIAKSLVEIQKGQMHLMVDGDLFKVTLIFPLA